MYTAACIFVLLSGGSGCQSDQSTTLESPSPSEVPAEAPAEVPAEVAETGADRILRNAEAQRSVVQSVTGTVAVERVEPLFNKRDVRTGTLYYDRLGDGPPRFALLLEKRLVGRRLESRKKHVVYDGRWLSEIDHQKRQCIRWELCGDDTDPTRLDGRFPLPIGQPREEVKRRFEVTELKTGPEGTFLEAIGRDRTIEGLRLTPRVGTAVADEFTRIDVWYDTSNWLPVGVETIDTKDNIRRIRLGGITVNPKLGEEQVASMLGSTPTGEDWMVDQRPCAPPAEPDP